MLGVVLADPNDDIRGAEALDEPCVRQERPLSEHMERGYRGDVDDVPRGRLMRRFALYGTPNRAGCLFAII